jgi:hypothetical protein
MLADRKRDHPNKPHSWMGDEDIEHAKMPMPDTEAEWAALAETHPCNCWCNGRTPVVFLRAEDSSRGEETGDGDAV